MSFARDVLDEADELGLAWWEHLALILAVALITVASRRAGAAVWNKIRSIEWKVEPAPEPVSDGGTDDDRALPPAVTDPTASGRPPESESGSGG